LLLILRVIISHFFHKLIIENLYYFLTLSSWNIITKLLLYGRLIYLNPHIFVSFELFGYAYYFLSLIKSSIWEEFL